MEHLTSALQVLATRLGGDAARRGVSLVPTDSGRGAARDALVSQLAAMP